MTKFEILDAFLTFRREISQMWSAATKDFDLGPNQTRLMFQLYKTSATIGELADATFTDKASVSRTITLLEKGGFVKRVGDRDDARIVRIELNAKGRAVAKKAHDIRKDVSRTLEARLTASEIKEFERLLSKLTQSQNHSPY